MKLDPTSLKLFVCVLEEGTIAAAAERSHLAAAAVSKRLSELETALRMRLLTRTNKGVEPTAAGIALLNRARRVLHELEETYAQMREYADGIRGQIRVFANISAITQFLPAELKSFTDEYPHVQVDLKERTSAVITKAVAENIADVGIFIVIPHGYDLVTFPYHSDELVVIAPRAHPLASKSSVSFAETLDFDYVGLHPEGAISLQLIKAASELNRTLKLRIQVTAYDALCLMVTAGLGIGVLPKHALKPYSRALHLKAIPLSEPWAHRELRICVRSLESLPIAAKLLVDRLRAKK